MLGRESQVVVDCLEASPIMLKTWPSICISRRPKVVSSWLALAPPDFSGVLSAKTDFYVLAQSTEKDIGVKDISGEIERGREFLCVSAEI